MDNALTVIPFLEEIGAVLLVSRVDLGEEHHLAHELSLGETLVDEQIVFLMHSSVAALAASAEYFKASSQSGRVESVPGDVRGPVVVTVVHTDRVDLFFVTLDAVRSTNVVSE